MGWVCRLREKADFEDRIQNNQEDGTVAFSVLLIFCIFHF